MQILRWGECSIAQATIRTDPTTLDGHEESAQGISP
jgi:hypothetical protein